MSDNCNEALAVEVKNFKEFMFRMEVSFDKKFDDFKQDNKEAHVQLVNFMNETKKIVEAEHKENLKKIDKEGVRISSLEKSRMWIKAFVSVVGAISFAGFSYIGYTLTLIEKNYSYEIKTIIKEETKNDKDDIAKIKQDLSDLTSKLKELELTK